MRPILSRLIAPLAFAIMTAACATSPQPVAPPRLTLPEAAVRPCPLAVLPSAPSVADLDTAYVLRGAQVVGCDAARALAVDTLDAEHRLIDEWLRLERRRRDGWWRRLWPGQFASRITSERHASLVIRSRQ